MGTHHNMENHDSPMGMLLSIGSIILYVLSKITVSDLAAMMAIFSGFAGGLYYITKWVMMIKNKKTDL